MPEQAARIVLALRAGSERCTDSYHSGTRDRLYYESKTDRFVDESRDSYKRRTRPMRFVRTEAELRSDLIGSDFSWWEAWLGPPKGPVRAVEPEQQRPPMEPALRDIPDGLHQQLDDELAGDEDPR